MLKALHRSMGIVSTAAAKANISRQTHYNWLKTDQAYKEAADLATESVIDFAESKLFQQIGYNDTTCIIFFLKTKGKNRGYVERTEQVVKKGGRTVVRPDADGNIIIEDEEEGDDES
ncbi:hypothetical protein [Spirosoma sp.]|uniref:hypothetical protein n=1 Tax=Spirosoma sp. TaxID=1899569 RepID=UPI0026181FD8|nr:hypothetical protein [Spirosoma sp.]MCX6218365.1 hypothetical protein [Spirosoma sp.]